MTEARAQLAGGQVFLDVGTHAAISSVPGLEAAKSLIHIEALELDYLPAHLIVIGGGYSASNWPRLTVASAAT